MRALLSSKPESRSTNQKIFFAAVTVALVGMLAKAGITVKELIVAKMVWPGRRTGCFSHRLPCSILHCQPGCWFFGRGVYPGFYQTRKRCVGAAAAQKLFSGLLVMLVLILVGLAVVLGVLAPYYLPFLGSNFSPEKLLFTRRLLCWMLPFIVFNGAKADFGHFNAGEKFARAGNSSSYNAAGDDFISGICRGQLRSFFSCRRRGSGQLYRSGGTGVGAAIAQIVCPDTLVRLE